MSRIPKDLLARLDYFNHEVENLFQRLFGSEMGAGFDHEDTMPCLDLLETEDEIILRADLPGVPKDAVDLHAAPNYIMIRGQKEPEDQQADCLRVERTFGSFQRLVSLPTTADVGGIKAVHSKGVLEVRMPKLKERRKGQRTIPIT